MTTIYFENYPVAELYNDDGLKLRYDKAWEARKSAFPISVSMPLESGPFPAEQFMPWLANLLPESHLSEISQQLKRSPQDVIGILQSIGRDTAGAMSIGAPRKPGNNFTPIANVAILKKILDELSRKPFLIGERGVSMSLAGVQDKLPVFIEANGQMGIPTDGTPSTHIIKPDAKRLKGSVQNEAFCMKLAIECGLDAAEVSTGKAGSRSYILVKRYDRIRDKEGMVRRIHQEDFCQILGCFPSRKYERPSIAGEKGPSLSDMFAAVRDLVSPGERLKLLDGVIFNVLICNADSHAKNYAILIGAGGSARFAPLYDLLCANVYPFVDHMLPQKIAGRDNAANLNGADWKKFANDAGLSPAATLKRVEELISKTEASLEKTAEEVAMLPAGNHDIVQRTVHEIKKRCKRVSRQL
jgi:serine/threonine-protein kinase HipA